MIKKDVENRMVKIAVILTVYNRRNTTLEGLRSIHKIISTFGNNYVFTIYMTDDGCTDGTGEAVAMEFPDVIITKGDGNLFWAGGMNKSWKAANHHDKYDYFIWFNDDALLLDNAFNLLFEPIYRLGSRVIVSGAFKDSLGNVSYGGRDKRKKLISPNGTSQPIFYMNGNLTLIPAAVVQEIGYLDIQFLHLGGDWDYGLRAQKRGIKVVLTSDYVGITDRHDKDAFSGSLIERFHKLYSKKHNPFVSWRFYRRHFGICCALFEFLKRHITTIFPSKNVRR